MDRPVRGSAFSPATDEMWRARVERDLKSASFTRRLVAHTHEGIDLGSLFPGSGESAGDASVRDVLREAPGSSADGWDIVPEIAHPDVSTAIARIEREAARGARGVWLPVTLTDGAPTEAAAIVLAGADDLRRLLDAAAAGGVAVHLEPGGEGSRIVTLLPDAVRGESPGLHLGLGLDPLGALAATATLPESLESALDVLAAEATDARTPGVRVGLVSTRPYHEAGATAVDEVAFAMATGATYLRHLTERGMTGDDAASQLVFAFDVDSDLFMEMAKLRAARWLWSKVLAASGASARMRLHARTSRRSLTRRDPWVNLLRVTVQTFAAGTGGADSIATMPFDAAIGLSDDFARDLASNTQVMLQEETSLGRVHDPAGGSGYVETLTERVARAAWTRFRGIESRGGMENALREGRIQTELEAKAAERAEAVATRRDVIVGVSEFPNLDAESIARPSATEARATAVGRAPSDPAGPAEQIRPLTVWRPAEPFETLRDASDRQLATSGMRPRVFLTTLGPAARHKPRADFTRGLFQAGGFEVITSDGLDGADDAVAAFRSSGTRATVICGTDDDYVTSVPAFSSALREAGARPILVAGRPGGQKAAWRDAGVDGYVHLGCDVLETLRTVLVEIGDPT